VYSGTFGARSRVDHPLLIRLPLRRRHNQSVGAYRRQIIMATVVGAILIGLYLLSSPVTDSGDDATTAVPGDADPAAVEVIEGWANTLREGDIDGAAEFFAIPSVAVNGLALRINDVEDARRFNASLPCGAILEEAVEQDGFTVATFELTERPGPGTCGSGTGATANTAFKIEDGKIVEWRRVVGGDGEGEGQPAPSSSA
jgi:hypothetical protein